MIKELRLFKIKEHYYLISGDIIHANNWFINIAQSFLYKNDIENYDTNKWYLRKVIASTDKSIGVQLLRLSKCLEFSKETDDMNQYIKDKSVDIRKKEYNHYKEDFERYAFSAGFREGFRECQKLNGAIPSDNWNVQVEYETEDLPVVVDGYVNLIK